MHREIGLISHALQSGRTTQEVEEYCLGIVVRMMGEEHMWTPVLAGTFHEKLMAGTAGSDFVDEDGPTFSDVPTTATFFDEIEWLAMTDITTGYLERGEAPTFRGSESVLREQMAAFLYRFDQLSS